jgi:hypothetical protein
MKIHSFDTFTAFLDEFLEFANADYKGKPLFHKEMH